MQQADNGNINSRAKAATTAPVVSFVIPVRNDARRLARCLATIRANHYPQGRIEVVVVDNGSTDESVDVAKHASAKVLVRPGLSVGQLRNLGAAAASGEILAFVDADHEIVPEWVGYAVETLSRSNVGVVGSLCEAPGTGTWVQHTYDLLRRRPAGVREVEWLGSGNLALWRSAFDAAGGFDTRLQTCEDVDLCRRVRLGGVRILQDSRLRNVHLGDPATLQELFRGELWRGRDNLRASLRPPVALRDLPSIVLPIADVSLAAVALVALLTGGKVGLLVAGIAVSLILGAAAARAARMMTQPSQTTALRCGQAFAVALVYDLARALALLRPGRHEARRAVRP